MPIKTSIPKKKRQAPKQSPITVDHASPDGAIAAGADLLANAPMSSARAFINDRWENEGSLTLRWWRDEFWKWDGRIYKRLADPELESIVLGWLENRIENVKPRNANEVVKCLKSLCLVPSEISPPCFLNEDGVLAGGDMVAFANGLADIGGSAPGTEILPHTPKWFSMSVLPFDFDPAATHLQWDRFLKEVLIDAASIDLLQRWFGLLLTSDTSYQKLLLMVGPPRAGKGTVTRTMQHVLGSDNVTSPSLSSFAGEFGLWPLVDKSVAILPDAHLSRRADDARILETIKSIVGEDPVNVNRKCLQQLNNVRLGIRFVVTVNELPHFTDASGALAARLCILPFPKSFLGQEDLALEEKLKAEASGILNWALEGLQRLRQEGGFNAPKGADVMLSNYRRLTNPVLAFLEDCCEVGSDKEALCDDVYGAWREWAVANGHAAMAKSTFGERIRAANTAIDRRRRRTDKGERLYYYVGLELTDDGRRFLGGGCP